MMIIRLILCFLLLPSLASAELYYNPSLKGTLAPPTSNGNVYHVAKTGSDSNNGLSEGTAWLTMAKAMDRYTNRGGANGAIVLVHAGTYYEGFTVPETWTRGTTPEDGIIVSAAGDGEVIFDRSWTPHFGAWSVHSGSIYKSTADSIPALGIRSVIIDDDFYSYHPKTSLVAVGAEGDWYFDQATGVIYVYTLSSKGDPTDDDVIISNDDGGSSSSYGVTFHDNGNYVTLYGVTVRGSASHGIFDSTGNTNNKIEQCEIKYHAKGGIAFDSASYSSVIKSLVHGNIMRNWPRGKWNSVCADINAGGWPAGLGGSGSDHMTISGSIITDNSGEGTLFYKGAGENTWEDNIVGNNWSANIYADNFANPTIRRNFLFSTKVFGIADIGEHCTVEADQQRVLRRCRPEGVMTADEDYGTGANYTGGKIYSNVILGCRRGVTHYGEATGSGVKNTKVYNNTIVLPNSDPSLIADVFYGISYSYMAGNNTGSEVKNNVIIGNAGGYGSVVKWLEVGETDPGIVWNYNVYYHPNNATPFRYRATNYNFADWKTQTGGDANSENTSPGIIRTDWSMYQ